jgi:predicted DNA-binding transcriptional regulator YafY
MPRNDQITRQWHLLRRLEDSNGLSLRQIIESVPDDYPKNARTVRRDIAALEAVGFPIITERRNGQSRWRLIEGFRNIPALGFSATELMALTVSRKLLRPLEGTEIQAALNSALNKVASALPPARTRMRSRSRYRLFHWFRPAQKLSTAQEDHRPDHTSH